MLFDKLNFQFFMDKAFFSFRKICNALFHTPKLNPIQSCSSSCLFVFENYESTMGTST